MKVLVSLLLFLATASASSISVLTAGNLRSEIQAHPLSLIMYEAPWSPQSIEGKPVLEKMAAEKSKLFVGSLDCETKETNDVCNREKVEAYPTIRLYREGKEAVDFMDDITKENLEKFLADPEAYPKIVAEKEAKEKEIKDPAMELEAFRLDMNQFTATVNVYKNMFVLYYAPWCPRSLRAIELMKKKYAKILKQRNINLFTCNCDYMSHRELCRSKMSYLPHIEVFIDSKPVLNSEKFFKEINEMNDEEMQAIFEAIDRLTSGSTMEDEVEGNDIHSEAMDVDEPTEQTTKTRDEL